MKFYESSFEEYLHSNKEYNIHPELDKIYKKLPMNIHKLENIIIYGPSGCCGLSWFPLLKAAGSCQS